jgi:hypothetical protein
MELRDCIRKAAGREGGVADEVEKLASPRDRGVITAVPFESQKAKLLG